MFGLGFWEVLVIAVVGVVVLGPRKLPDLMRTAGQWIARARRLSVQLRAESGIDDLIRQEGLEREIRELRSLASANVLGSLAAAAAAPAPLPAPPPSAPRLVVSGVEPPREREYPEWGCDVANVTPDEYASAPEPEASAAAEGSGALPTSEAIEPPSEPASSGQGDTTRLTGSTDPYAADRAEAASGRSPDASPPLEGAAPFVPKLRRPEGTVPAEVP